MSVNGKTHTLLDIFKKYIPQCDKMHNITLRFGNIIPSNFGIIQQPIEISLVNHIQTLLQSNKSFKKTTVSGWRIYSNGVIYEQNKRSGEIMKQYKVIEHTSNSDNIVCEFESIDEESSIVPALTKPNMEEEFERITYRSTESGLVDIEWNIEHSVLSKYCILSCVIRKPVHLGKLVKHLQSFGFMEGAIEEIKN
jgi:hypothetical protein